MDPVVIAAGTTLVKLMATDAWAAGKEAVVAWWRKHHPEQAEQVGADLERLHVELADADAETRTDLTGELRSRLRRLLADDPALGVELRRLVDEELTPILTAADRGSVSVAPQTMTVKGNRNISIQTGRDAHFNSQPPPE